MRVETNGDGEFEIKGVYKNGPAERSGRVFVGDILDSVDGRPLSGLKIDDLKVSVGKDVCVCGSFRGGGLPSLVLHFFSFPLLPCLILACQNFRLH
jgi:hypothetical protein